MFSCRVGFYNGSRKALLLTGLSLIMENIAVVILDTLRSDYFDKHFEWLPGIRFENAWSTSHWTVPSHASLFTGKYASEVGVYAGSQHLDCRQEVLTELLSNAGYKTRGISCNINISSAFSFDRGFDSLKNVNFRAPHRNPNNDLYDWSKFIAQNSSDTPRWIRYLKAVQTCFTEDCATLQSLIYGVKNMSDIGTGEVSLPDMGAQSVLDQLRELEFDNQEFLYLNLMEAHGPYNIPEKYTTADEFETPDHPRGKITEEIDLEPLKQRYDDAVSYLSEKYKQMFEILSANFDYIFTLSDHGELLGEHGFTSHNYGVFPELVKIPLCLSTGEQDHEFVSESVNLLDVHQTILQIAGIESESRGENLLDEPTDRKVLTEYHGIAHPERNKAKLKKLGLTDEEIAQFDEDVFGIYLPPQYYGYQSLDGFGHKGQSPVESPQEEIETFRENLSESTGSDQQQTIPDSVKSDLEDLGYL